MKVKGTEYRLATTTNHYKMCHALARQNEVDVKLSFPTVIAIREGKLVGFLTTKKSKQAVIAGPLVMNGLVNKAIVAMRLAEGYEEVLSEAGVTDYIFSVDKGHKWRRSVEVAFGIKPYGESDRAYWYRRHINEQ